MGTEKMQFDLYNVLTVNLAPKTTDAQNFLIHETQN